LANKNLPYIINRNSQMQAANPALEMARLTSMLGVGTKTLSFIASLLMALAVFSIFAAIAGGLENRKAELAVLRALGFSRMRIFALVAGEGLCLVITGCLIGGVLSYIGFSYLPNVMPSLAASGASFQFTAQICFVYIGAVVAGFLAAFIPAFRASRIDVAKQLG
jgi:putative ABC transport system permease protein